MDMARAPGRVVLTLLCILTGCGGDDGSETSDPGGDTAPLATITAPGTGARVPLDTQTALSGTVSDLETPVTQLVATWRSSVEGDLGDATPDANGQVSLEHRFDIAATHTVTLTVTDSAGNTSEASISLVVDAPPTAQIDGTDPSSPLEAESLTVSGTVSDDADDVRNLEITWIDEDGNLLGASPASKNGAVSLTIAALEAGKHTITLVATDSLGQEGSDSLSLTVQACPDGDGDGWTPCEDDTGAADCDDSDPDSYPGAAEVCDGADQDCNGIDDNGFPDADGDKIMDCVDVEECDGLDNDGDRQVDEGYPDADDDGVADCVDAEACDGVDNDGNGVIDNGFPDTDADGLADCIDPCPNPATDSDLDDDGVCDALDNCPEASNADQSDTDGDGEGDACDLEICNGIDDDGDGDTDEGFDDDGDGWPACVIDSTPADCDDADYTVYPYAPERCDGLDNDCDGSVDDGLPDTDLNGTPDCRDAEACDGVDNDGDAEIDEGFPDTDADGIADCLEAEECDGADNDGDGLTDEGFTDTDGDLSADCVDPCPGTGITADDTDGDGVCDSEDDCPSTVDPLQEDTDGDGVGDACDPEVCNGADDDGDGEIDDGYDQDGDGWYQCAAGGAAVDCDDGDAAVYPGAPELCDSKDNDCDDTIDIDEYEPNDSLDGATFLGDLNGEDSVVTYTLQGTVHASTDSDFYKLYVYDDFALGEDQFYLSADLTGVPSGANYDLYLWWDDPEDDYFTGTQVVESSTNTGNQEDFVRHNGDSGPDNGGYFWIEIRPVSGSSCDHPYTLTIENKG